ncbi:MAG: cell wall hydrolase [Lachnospiraceae bacterium]|nr:cell wall hydrolase [Lachnospiraceae bacterium]
MKIRKVEEKPMVLHTKKNPKLHRRDGKKPEKSTKAKKKGTLFEKAKNCYKESAAGVKIKSGHIRTVARVGMGMVAEQIEGGEEIRESAEVMAVLSYPIAETISKGAVHYRKRQQEKRAKRKKKAGKERESVADYAGSMERRRAAVGVKDKREKKADKKKKDSDRGSSGTSSAVKSRMIESFMQNFRQEQEKKKSMAQAVKEVAKEQAVLLVKRILAAVAPAFLAFFGVVGIVAVIVVAILAVIYNSPLAVFFPLPDTGYENPRTVLTEYYKEFNEQVIALEDGGSTVTWQNTENGVVVSNYNDTLMVFMVLYANGQAGYVMDDTGKKNLKKVFDEMNYFDTASSAVEKQVGDSIGEVMVTAYCPCPQCCGPYANGITASGKTAKPKHTIAVDAYHPIVPMGTKVVIEGVVYTVEDTGNLNHYGNDFDIFYASHAETSQWGRRKVEAFLAEGNSNTVKIQTSGTVVHNLTYEDYIAKGKLTPDEEKLLREMMSSDLWKQYYSSAAGQAVAELAMTKVGCRYDQSRRMEEGYYDCSSLVYRLYKEVGIELPLTAAEQGKYCYQNAMVINKKELKPGDLIFYSYEENGDFHNISHVAIYVGDGKMVHAANKSRGVVIDSLRTRSVVFYARPYN